MWKIQYMNNKQVVPIYITRTNGHNLLGRDWLNKISVLQVNSLGVLSRVEDLIKQYAKVFKNPEEGLLNGMKITLPLLPHVQPKFYKARTIPYMLRPKVEAELERLQNNGIIEPLQFSRMGHTNCTNHEA